MKSQEILQILKQIFDLNPNLEKIISEKLKNLDETKEKELLVLLLNYTKKQNELIKELNNTLIKGKNQIDEYNDTISEESPEEIISKI
ncbi:MAG: hypothetical protein PHH98_00635 [Candidatus Gracilibacteria bacterium]|nr:hypothetical protein [Candidatus Gracilibacteria bacterium]